MILHENGKKQRCSFNVFFVVFKVIKRRNYQNAISTRQSRAAIRLVCRKIFTVEYGLSKIADCKIS